MKKVLLVIASQNYQPHEYGATKQVLESLGHQVITASDVLGTAQAAYDNSSIEVDITLAEARPDSYDAIFFIGGPGALVHLDNQASYDLLQSWQASGKPYGAICISPRILAKAGVLQNKKATGWDGDNELTEIFSEHEVEYVREDVVVDGKVVTASGPEAAEEFGRKIAAII